MIAYYWGLARAVGCDDVPRPGDARRRAPRRGSAHPRRDDRTAPRIEPSDEMLEAEHVGCCGARGWPGGPRSSPWRPGRRTGAPNAGRPATSARCAGGSPVNWDSPASCWAPPASAPWGRPSASTPTRARAVVDLTGRTDLGTLIGVLASAGLFVGNDSGPAHLAAALGRPGLTLFGSTSEAHSGPVGTADANAPPTPALLALASSRTVRSGTSIASTGSRSTCGPGGPSGARRREPVIAAPARRTSGSTGRRRRPLGGGSRSSGRASDRSPALPAAPHGARRGRATLAPRPVSGRHGPGAPARRRLARPPGHRTAASPRAPLPRAAGRSRPDGLRGARWWRFPVILVGGSAPDLRAARGGLLEAVDHFLVPDEDAAATLGRSASLRRGVSVIGPAGVAVPSDASGRADAAEDPRLRLLLPLLRLDWAARGTPRPRGGTGWLYRWLDSRPGRLALRAGAQRIDSLDAVRDHPGPVRDDSVSRQRARPRKTRASRASPSTPCSA